MSAGSPEGRKTSEISAFWRDLEEQFLQLQDTRLRGASGGNDFVCKRLNDLIEQGASKIAGADAPDLLGIWMEALEKEGFDLHFSSESDEGVGAAEPWQSISRPAIDWHCQTSATLCRRLAARAVHAEFNGQDSQPRRLNYRSSLKRAVLLGLTQKPNSTDRELCGWLDEEGAADLPTGLAKNGDRLFVSAYLDPGRKPKLESTISKVRCDMRMSGLLK